MACPLCGDLCTCSTAGDLSGGRTTVLIDPDSITTQTAVTTTAYSEPIVVNQAVPEFYRPLDNAWRNEISSRVRAHRRRRGHDADASLDLGFDQPLRDEIRAVRSRFSTGNREPLTDHDGVSPEPVADRAREPEASPRPSPSRYQRIAMKRREAQMESGVVIEFPRPQTYDLFPDALAEPLPAIPRILEVPEELALDAASAEFASACQSAYASIELDSPHQVAADLNEPVDLELPLQVAPLSPRIVSAMIDAGLVCTATALFAVTVLLLAPFGPAAANPQMAVMPDGKLAVALGVSLPALFWAAYQYLFLVYAGITPGMQMAQVELSSFEGCFPARPTRIARAAALVLSCLSLGMGFGWAFFDEDSLGWHDRITRTYLRQS